MTEQDFLNPGLPEIAEKIENMIDERAALECAWEAIHGAAPRRTRSGDTAENRFVSMLDCRAFESAALQLLDDRARHSWAAGEVGEDDQPWACITAHFEEQGCPDYNGGGCVVSISIAAAVLRAIGNRVAL